MARGESLTSPRRLLAVERQVRALELRRAGFTYTQIAHSIGYRGRQGAQNAVCRALMRMPNRATKEELTLDLERVDSLFARPFAAALAGDLDAVRVCLAIMERRARLLGLD